MSRVPLWYDCGKIFLDIIILDSYHMVFHAPQACALPGCATRRLSFYLLNIANIFILKLQYFSIKIPVNIGQIYAYAVTNIVVKLWYASIFKMLWDLFIITQHAFLSKHSLKVQHKNGQRIGPILQHGGILRGQRWGRIRGQYIGSIFSFQERGILILQKLALQRILKNE